MKGTGTGEQRILFISDHPSHEEDATGQPWRGDSLKTLRMIIRENKFDIDIQQCRKINAVSCRPEDGVATPTEVNACRCFVFQEVHKYKPEIIFLMGDQAIQSFYGHRMRDDEGVPSVRRMRGFQIPDYELGAWVVPIEHPSFVLKREKNPVVRLIMAQDIRKGLEKQGVSLPSYPVPDKCIRTDLSVEEIINFLGKVKARKPRIAFDYETTGLKPHAKGHKVYSIGVAVSPTRAVAFQPHRREIKALWREILLDPDIYKVTHNIAMEFTWSAECFDCIPEGMDYDTRLVAHLEDNREGITGLKFQTFLHYGIMDYSDVVGPFLRSSKGSGDNGFNRIKNAPLKQLMKYNALDALFTYWHWNRQVSAYETI
jgi:uracil-DNA glycosylase family 4